MTLATCERLLNHFKFLVDPTNDYVMITGEKVKITPLMRAEAEEHIPEYEARVKRKQEKLGVQPVQETPKEVKKNAKKQ